MFCCKKDLFYCVSVVFMLLQGQVMLAQDTLKTYELEGVRVEENRIMSHIPGAFVAQSMNTTRLEKIPAMQFSDAVKHFSGVTVKDYGGTGGIKTVSVRSLGANHTLISYDGLAVSDYQTGQINIGRFSLDNMAFISLNNGENGIFHPARLFSFASVLNFQTIKPVFSEKKPVNVRVSFRGGSFLLLNPSLLVENRIGKRVSTSINTEYIYNKGEYPYTMQNGDTVFKERRKNTDVQIFRTDANCFVNISRKQFLSAKLFYYYAEQGLPGAVILYNTQSRQRMWEENVFTQLHYRYDISQKVSYQANGKINYGYIRYLDPDYLNIEGKLDNQYWQREYYISNAVLYKPLKGFSMSFANDLSLGNMNTSLPDFANPVRYSSLSSFSLAYHYKRIGVFTTLIHTYTSDKTQTAETKTHHQKFTPSVSFFCRPFKKMYSISIQAFYKNIFRLPTFNDLYYRLLGNTNLSPEKTHQISLGATWSKFLRENKIFFSITTDVYHNRIQDKIIAIPNKNLFIWSMINLGKVSITGVEVQNALEVKAHKHIDFEFRLNYTFQHAVDITNENSKTYKNQIPYTPKHSGSGIFSIQTKWVNCSYSVLYAGERYMLGQNIPANHLEKYFDHSFALYRNFKLKKTELTLRAECLNLLNKQYEVVKSYPMTGRQFQGKIVLKF